jgi:hypothetical protein
MDDRRTCFLLPGRRNGRQEDMLPSVRPEEWVTEKPQEEIMDEKDADRHFMYDPPT